MDDEKCSICHEAYLSRDNVKYCGNCSAIFWRIKSQKRFEGSKIEDIETEVRLQRKRIGRSNCGRKPAHLKIRIVTIATSEAITA